MDIKSALRKIFPKRNEPGEQSGLRLGIPWPMLLAICLVLICAIGWAFFMGLMVGRGQNPTASLQTMAGMNVEENTGAADPVVASTPETPPAEVATPPPSREPAAPPSVAVATPKPEKIPVSRKLPPAPKPAPGQQFDYTFQAAAFKTQTEAKKINVQLNKNGMRSEIKKSGKAYLVVISLRGGPQDVIVMQKKLSALKLGKPMQLSRKPVERRQGRRNGQR